MGGIRLRSGLLFFARSSVPLPSEKDDVIHARDCVLGDESYGAEGSAQVPLPDADPASENVTFQFFTTQAGVGGRNRRIVPLTAYSITIRSRSPATLSFVPRHPTYILRAPLGVNGRQPFDPWTTPPLACLNNSGTPVS
ncbi:uncharacterized protein CIMG_12296 [Coccidioides immitis RS]|uniref:Uncharacterized protein n=1 Tax=Coccidioides immitis (strain RS) TaxID=246410 RepID=A0A0D8JVK0_COCIM|nr:uncharacterized protein CIMG_12296 [Coccidioides immitis RS]KJF61337.1 hypothetical protein CIMG_12296 [Coccidioides immitis RS]